MRAAKATKRLHSTVASTKNFESFRERVKGIVPADRFIEDPLKRFAYGTDASGYRLTPQLVVKVESEDEVRAILPLSVEHSVPITFRAAGTSLSGQAITDSVLIKLGSSWDKYQILENGDAITLQPGLIGGHVNRLLAPYHRKIGPDPSSIDSCMIGGIINNNSSGMCCGVAQNSYNTIRDLRVVFTDGSVLDTADAESRYKWAQSHPHVVEGVLKIRDQILSNSSLVERINRKYSIKCTTGYSMNSFVDHSDPIEIIKHLIVGSEGTLAFLSQVTLSTIFQSQNKCSAMVVFNDVEDACEATIALKKKGSVAAAEIMDSSCMKSAMGQKGFDAFNDTSDRSAALLIECRGTDAENLKYLIDETTNAIRGSGAKYVESSLKFSHDADLCETWWDFRRGLLPRVGALRTDGTTALIEDIAAPISNLANLTLDAREILTEFHYPKHESVILGHALDGNLHISIAIAFEKEAELKRYASLMDSLMDCVITKHHGSCKAEHGTGRNVAPWVEKEWGSDAFELMWDVKALFDQKKILSPGILLTRDNKFHLKHLKSTPVAHPLINKCNECGFCESNCPSKDLSFTPRQRIAAYREIQRLEQTGENPELLEEYKNSYEYNGVDTCAADGMCSMKCPFGINTGELVKTLRNTQSRPAPAYETVANFASDHFSLVSAGTRHLLNFFNFVHYYTGPLPLTLSSVALRAATLAPKWNPQIPKAATNVLEQLPLASADPTIDGKTPVVFFCSCVGRVLGSGSGPNDPSSTVTSAIGSLMKKANVSAIVPEWQEDLCCGLAFDSKGFRRQGAQKMGELERALIASSHNGEIPILVENSPCCFRIKEKLKNDKVRAAVMDTTAFIKKNILPNVTLTKKKENITLHVPCSSAQMGLSAPMLNIAQQCAEKIVPSQIPCCGMAGDRGLSYPELNASALKKLAKTVEDGKCSSGISTSRTCEIGLSHHAGVPFSSLAQLVDECATPK